MKDECREIVATLFSLEPNILTRQIKDIKIPNSPGILLTIKTRLKIWLTYFGLNINTIPDNLFSHLMGIYVINSRSVNTFFANLNGINSDKTHADTMQKLKISIILSTMDPTVSNCDFNTDLQVYGIGKRKKTYKKKTYKKKTYKKKTYKKVFKKT
jgi:hypothetical protein